MALYTVSTPITVTITLHAIERIESANASKAKVSALNRFKGKGGQEKRARQIAADTITAAIFERGTDIIAEVRKQVASAVLANTEVMHEPDVIGKQS